METSVREILLPDGRAMSTEGLLINIIDFSLSRHKTGMHALAFVGNDVFYTDLNETDWLFQGDGRKSSQYEVYRRMKKAANGNWKAFNPKTNVLWVEFITRRLLGSCSPRADSVERSKIEGLRKRILGYESVNQMVSQDAYFSSK